MDQEEQRFELMTVPVIGSVVAFSLVLLHFILQMLSSSKSEVTLFYDECSALTYARQYIVRLLYDAKSTHFDDNYTSVFIEIEHSINRIVKIPFAPSTLARVFIYKKRRCAKIFIRTLERYHDVRSCVLFHNGRGSILVHSVELQDISEPNAIIALVNGPVFGGRQGNPTNYPFGMETPTELEEDTRPTRNVTIVEAIYFFYTSACAVYLVVLLLLQQYCTEEKVFCGWTKCFGIGFLAGLAAFGCFILLIFPYRYVVRPLYNRSLGRGCAKYLRYFYQGITVLGGVVCSVYCCELSFKPTYDNINKQGDLLSAGRIWLFASIFGIFCLFCWIGIAVPLAIYVNFIVLPSKGDPRSILKGFQMHPKAPPKYKSDEAYSQILSTVEVASSSIYTPQTSFTSPAVASTVPMKNTLKPNQDDYFHTLAAQKEQIRSISQFNIDKPQANQTVSRRKLDIVPPRRQQQADKRFNYIESPNIMQQRSAEVEPVSSLGDSYYDAVKKMTKVGSVSQYHRNN